MTVFYCYSELNWLLGESNDCYSYNKGRGMEVVRVEQRRIVTLSLATGALFVPFSVIPSHHEIKVKASEPCHFIMACIAVKTELQVKTSLSLKKLLSLILQVFHVTDIIRVS